MRLLREIGEFASYLFTLWGLLAAISLILPLGNTWWPTLPLQPGYARLATGLATLTCFFALLYSFVERHRLRTALRITRHPIHGWEPESMSLRAAMARFGWAMACLVFYFILDVGYERLSVQKGEFLELGSRFLSPLAVIAYALLFGLLTGAFGELAVIEYVKGRLREAAPAQSDTV